MLVYRISKMKERANDLSGRGAFLFGGRWNTEGTLMLYASMHASLSYLEILVHTDESELPPQMYISTIEISDAAELYEFRDDELPANWREPGNLRLAALGDRMMKEKKYLGYKVRSAVLPSEWNVLLNPAFPGFGDQVRIARIEQIETDLRLR